MEAYGQEKHVQLIRYNQIILYEYHHQFVPFKVPRKQSQYNRLGAEDDDCKETENPNDQVSKQVRENRNYL